MYKSNLSEFFECIELPTDSDLDINHKFFEQSWSIVISRDDNKDNSTNEKVYIDGDIYDSPEDKRVDIWSESYWLFINNNTLFVRYRSLNEVESYTLDKEFHKIHKSTIYKLPNNNWITRLNGGTYVQQLDKANNKISVNQWGQNWNSVIESYLARLKNNWTEVWLYNSKQIIINDLPYEIANQWNINDVEISKNWKYISVDITEVNSNPINRTIIIKSEDANDEIIENIEWTTHKMMISNNWEIARIAEISGKMYLQMNKYKIPLDIKNFESIDNIDIYEDGNVTIKYITLGNAVKDQVFSLNPDADEIVQMNKKKELDAKNNKEKLELLEEKNILTSVHLKKIIEDYDSLEGIIDDKKMTSIKLLEANKENIDLKDRIEKLTLELEELKTNMKIIKKWVTQKSNILGGKIDTYDITPVAKRALELT